MSPNRAEEDSHAPILANTAEPNPHFYGFLVYNLDLVNLAISELEIRRNGFSNRHTTDVSRPIGDIHRCRGNRPLNWLDV